jgi:thiamine biosynthesis lipoprotein
MPKIWSLFIFLGTLLIFSCSLSKKYYFIEGFAQGTTFHITYEGKKDYTHEIDSILKAFDLSLSSYNDSSLISRINRNEPNVLLDKWFITVYKKSEEVYKASDGMFDITVAPLVEAWGFLKDTTIKHDSLHIRELLRFVGMNKIHIQNNKLIKDDPGIKIDVNAIAQGFSVDVIAGYLEEQNIIRYLVEIGGEVKAKGLNPKGQKWRVGIDKPIDGNQIPGENLQTIIEITDRAIATSGNYRKFFVEDNIKYTHTINPKTGYPAKNNLLSVSIIADDCMSADAYATACMVSGLEKSKQIIANNNLEGYLVYSDTSGNFKVFITPGFQERITK